MVGRVNSCDHIVASGRKSIKSLAPILSVKYGFGIVWRSFFPSVCCPTTTKENLPMIHIGFDARNSGGTYVRGSEYSRCIRMADAGNFHVARIICVTTLLIEAILAWSANSRRRTTTPRLSDGILFWEALRALLTQVPFGELGIVVYPTSFGNF